MVALKGKSIEGALAKRDPAFSAFLVYGPDQGLVSERVTRLAHQVVTDLNDPFNFMELSEADLKSEPGRLSDEITALSFMGGERVIRVRCNGEAAGPAIPGFLDALDKDHLKPNGIVVIDGGDLGPRSSLRKAFEKAKKAASLPCYNDTPVALRTVATQMAEEFGLQFDKDALALTTQILGEDRGITRSELEKLCLYKMPPKGGADSNSDRLITLGDVRACLVDGVSDALDEVISACADGRTGPLSVALHRSATGGINPVSILRSLQRQFSRLKQARHFMDEGANPNEAMKKLRPPVFFGEQDAFRERLNSWPTLRLKQAQRMLTQVELEAKTTGAPQRELVERAALRLARMVRR